MNLKQRVIAFYQRCRAALFAFIDWLRDPSQWPGTLWRYGRVLWVCRVAVVNAVAGGFLLAGTPQARDFFSDLGLSAGHWVLFLVLTFLWAWLVHASARRALLADDWVPESKCGSLTPDRRIQLQQLFLWPATVIPRLLGLLIFVFVLIALARAYANLLDARKGVVEAHQAVVLIRWLTVGTLFMTVLYIATIWTRRDVRQKLTKTAQPDEPLLMGIQPFPISLWRQNLVTAPTSTLLDWALLAAALVITGFFGWAFFWPHYVAETLPRVLMVPVLLGGVVLFLNEIGIHSLRWRLPLLLMLAGAALIFQAGADRFHDVRFMKAQLAAGSAQGGQPQIDFREAVTRWKKVNGDCDPGSDTKPCPRPILIAGAGGASRAAFMTATVAGALIDLGYEKRETYGNVRNRIFAMSTVSGSSLGAVVMRAALTDAAETEPSAPPCKTATGRHGWFRHPAGTTSNRSYTQSWRDCFQMLLSGDYLSPVLIGLFYRDNFPVSSQDDEPIWSDRAVLLERAFERHYAKIVTGSEASCGDASGKGLCRPFGWHPDPGSKNTWIPLLFINGTSVWTGRRVVASDSPLGIKDKITNKVLMPLAYDLRELRDVVWEKTTAPGEQGLSRNVEPDSKLAQGKTKATVAPPKESADIRLSTAATVSARFPVVSPQGNLRSQGIKVDAVVDGGYYENDGLATIADVVLTLRGDFKLDPVVIRIVNEPEETKDAARSEPDRPPLPRASQAGFLDEASSIVRTLISTRSGHLDGDLEYLKGVLKSKARLYEFGVHPLTGAGKGNPLCRSNPSGANAATMKYVSMSWWMSQPVQAYLDAQLCLEENTKRLLCELDKGRLGGPGGDCD